MKPWFEDENLISKIDHKRSEDPAPSSPTESDVNEASVWIETQTKYAQNIIKVLFFGSAVLEFLVYTFVKFEAAIFFHITFSVLLFLAVIALVISISVKTKPLLLSRPYDQKTILSESFSLFPRVFLTTLALFFMVAISLPFFVFPAIFVLLFFIRAPYNAALGSSVKDAFRRSVLDRKQFPTGNLLLAVGFVNALLSIGFLVLVFEMVGPWIPWGLSELVFHLFKAATWVGIWTQSFAICLVGDAVFSNAIPKTHLAESRKGSPTSPILRLWNGLSKLGPLLILSVFFVLTQTDFRKPESSKSPSTREIAWEMENLAGIKTKSQKYDDKPMVVYAWAPWCVPCKIQTPHIKKLHEEKGQDYNVVSVALSYKTRKRVAEYADDYNLLYPVFYGTNAFQELTKVNAFPTTMIIKNKKIVQQWTGITSARRIKNALLND